MRHTGRVPVAQRASCVRIVGQAHNIVFQLMSLIHQIFVMFQLVHQLLCEERSGQLKRDQISCIDHHLLTAVGKPVSYLSWIQLTIQKLSLVEQIFQFTNDGVNNEN